MTKTAFNIHKKIDWKRYTKIECIRLLDIFLYYIFQKILHMNDATFVTEVQ